MSIQWAILAKKIPGCFYFAIIAAPLAWAAGLNYLAYGILAATPVAILYRALFLRSLATAEKQAGMKDITMIARNSVLRLAIVIAAFFGSIPFGPLFLFGVFLVIMVEMIIYIFRLWRLLRKS